MIGPCRQAATAAAVLILALHPAQAQDRFEAPEPVCGDFENVEVDGVVRGRQITGNCVPPQTEATGPSRSSAGRSGSSAPLAGAAGLVVLALALGSSGGGNDDRESAPAPPAPLPPPADATDPAAWRSEEFNRQYGLRMIGVEHRYAQGATGQGTLGAILDTGIDLDHQDVGGIRLDLSHSYVGTPNDLGDRDGHGSFVYGIAGARRNGFGIHGVAPDAEFMILRNNPDNDPLPEFADALHRSVAARVDAMNNSWSLQIPDSAAPGGSRDLLISDFGSTADLRTFLGPTLTGRLEEATEAGLSVVFATGNDGFQEVGVMAGLPYFLPRLQDNWIAATALDQSLNPRTAQIAEYANGCGRAMAWCLAAPGSNILSLDATGLDGTDADGLTTASGTSGAAPHVFGAALVLKSQFPELTTLEVHDILFETALDLGTPGTDPVYGRGALNLNEAMTPQGTLMVQMGDRVDAHTAPLAASWIAESAVTGGVFARAMRGQSALVTDRYDRGYLARLDSRVAAAPDAMPSAALVRMAAAMPAAYDVERADPDNSFALRLNPYGPGFDITRIAHADPVMALAGSGTGPGLSITTPLGRGAVTIARSQATDARAVSLNLSRPFGAGHRLAIGVGRLREQTGLLGATGSGAFGGLQGETRYGRLEADLALGSRVMLNASATLAATALRSDGLLARGALDSQAFALGMTWTGVAARQDRLSLAVAHPFLVSGGAVTLRSGRDISASEAGSRTNRVTRTTTSVPLEGADPAPELHIGYAQRFDAGRLGPATLGFGAIADLSGTPDIAAARVSLTFRF